MYCARFIVRKSVQQHIDLTMKNKYYAPDRFSEYNSTLSYYANTVYDGMMHAYSPRTTNCDTTAN